MQGNTEETKTQEQIEAAEAAENKKHTVLLEGALEKEVADFQEVDESGKPHHKTLTQNDLAYLLSDKTWGETLVGLKDQEFIPHLLNLGYEKPSKIQCKAIPFTLGQKGVGVLAQSHNGSGKTLSFLIPVILKVDLTKPLRKTDAVFFPQAIILAPTAELCSQTIQVGNFIGKYFPELKISRCLDPKDAAHIIVTTPAKLIQLILDKRIDLSNMVNFVVDEADGILKGDSGTHLNQAIATLPKGISLLFYSATFTPEAKSYINEFFKKLGCKFVFRYELAPEELTLDGIYQYAKRCEKNKKIEYLDKLILNLETEMQIIIFVNTRAFAETVTKELQNKNHSIEYLIGQLMPAERTKVLNNFREGKFKILVTTNVLARGFDQRTIGLVINLDIPRHYGDSKEQTVDLETYLHRIGRAGRFGDIGIALNVYTQESEKRMLDDISKTYKVEIEDISRADEAAEFAYINDLVDKAQKENQEKQKQHHEKIIKS